MRNGASQADWRTVYQGLQNKHALILTPNQRSARFLAERYADWQRGLGHTVWETPEILSETAWLHRSWQRIAEDDPLTPRLQSDMEAHLKWLSLLREHFKDDPLIRADDLLPVVLEAWQLCQRWQIDLHHPAFQQTPDSRLFRDWAEAMDERLHQDNSLHASQLAQAVAQRLDRLPLAVQHVYLYAFDEVTPDLAQLLNAIGEQDIAVSRLEPPDKTEQATLRAYDDDETEWLAAARWAEQQLQAGKQRLAVVIPTLAQHRQQVERIFRRVLDPVYLRLDRTPDAAPFNISAAVPLADMPLVRDTLQWLALDTRALERRDVDALSRSPFFAGGFGEASQRAHLRQWLRGHIATHISAERLLQKLDDPELAAPLFSGVLKARLDMAKTKAQPSQWAQRFANGLSQAGWPGERQLSSLEYQQQQHFFGLLDRLAELDCLNQTIAATEAVQWLKRLARQHPFQAQTPPSPVQVLGLLEAAGMVFDGLWVCGMDDASWPASPQPNPLLPPAIQAEKRLPNSSPDRELAYARRLTDRLRRSAPEVVFSYAAFRDDEALRPSRILADLNETETNAPQDDAWTQRLIDGATTLESVDDNQGPPTPAGQVARGGAGLLEAQAACPFKAFASKRLFLDQPIDATVGLSPMERGNLLHGCLEKLWAGWRGQDGLHNTIADGRLEDEVTKVVEEKLSLLARRREEPLGERYLALEQIRTIKLLLDWLDQEARRPPFRIEAVESQMQADIGPLTLKVRFDRIDRLADERILVMDYKTGDSTTAQWDGERPDKPQVPLYAISYPGEVAAAAMVQLNAKAVKAVGYAEGEVMDGLKPPREDWQITLDDWREQLTQLAEEHASGLARVEPKKGLSTCRYCHLRTVCRYQPDAELSE